jgi:hypothetical protein
MLTITFRTPSQLEEVTCRTVSGTKVTANAAKDLRNVLPKVFITVK